MRAFSHSLGQERMVSVKSHIAQRRTACPGTHTLDRFVAKDST